MVTIHISDTEDDFDFRIEIWTADTFKVVVGDEHHSVNTRLQIEHKASTTIFVGLRSIDVYPEQLILASKFGGIRALLQNCLQSSRWNSTSGVQDMSRYVCILGNFFHGDD